MSSLLARSTSLIAAAVVAVSIGPVLAASAKELVTAADAILCVSPENLDVANHRQVAHSPFVLQGIGCVRIENGIRTRLLEGSDAQRPWRVRVYPAGISGGVELWGMPFSFTAPDGSKALPMGAGA
jgi:hypothetical protein